MEASVVSGILKFVGNKLVLLLYSQYYSKVGAKRDLQELHDLVQELNNWLEAVGDISLGSFLTEMKDVAYAADSFVDELQLRVQKHDASGIMSKYMWAIQGSFIFQNKAKAIKNKFAAIARQRAKISETINSLQTGHPVDQECTVIIERNNTIVGRDEHINMITSKLVETDNRNNIIIVSIIGLGGSGKTRLAQVCCNNNIIGSHFDVRVWIHVSLEFDLEKLLKKLFEAITGERSVDHTSQHIINTTSSMLMGKRSLIILDDIWMEDRVSWEQFMVLFRNCAPGSRILLTTRSMGVVEAVDSTCVFHLQPLSMDESWILFLETLGMTLESLSPKFVEVGRQIVKKCGGLPLAIKVLACTLHGRERIEAWIKLWHAIGDFFFAHDTGRMIFNCLGLSYFNMPSHLKQCFAICAVFPKGYKIDKEKLIDLWIAHDMITPENSVEYLEHIGQRCFDSLLKISFLQVVSEGYGRVMYTMHDLIHDLAMAIESTSSTTSNRYFSITEQPRNLTENLFEEARAVYVKEGDYFKFGRALQNAKHLRSIIVAYTESVPTTIFQVKNLKYLEISGLKCDVLPEAISDIWSLQALRLTDCDILSLPNSFGNLQNLRTLHLSWCKRIKSLPGSVNNCHMISIMDLSGCIEFEVLPDFIGTNKRLKVLRISHTKIKMVPSSITLLGNLECLDLQQCPELVELPEGLENLKKLEVLNLEGCPKLRVSIKHLHRLQNLNILIVEEIEKYAKILEHRNINGTTYVMNPGDEQKACLKEKTDLQRLQLHWGRNGETNLEAVFDGLEPPSGIKELYVGGYTGGQYAKWMLKQVDVSVKGLSQFLLLAVMTLCGLPNLKHLDGLIGLPALEVLDLRWMPSLKSISGGPFPSLVKLRMEGLRSLEEVWMVTEGHLADGKQMEIGICLSKLHIEECPKLKVKPYFPSSLEHLVLHRSNEQLLLSSGQGQGPSSSSSFPATCRYSHLKELELWGMTSLMTSSSSSSSSLPPGSGSERGWELLQHMSTLESLKICQCTELPESIRSLKSLRSLLISFCCAILMLPEWLGELHSLQKMAIQSCHSLSGLPQSIGHLTSLQELQIERCDKLHQLPERLGKLCSLQKLKITGCPELEGRCEKEKGEDWHLIEHIPHRQIGFDEDGPAC